MKKDGGYAFPHSELSSDGNYILNYNGMSLRDYFAAAALQGMLAYGKTGPMKVAALECYQMADAMLAERERAHCRNSGTENH